MNTPDPVQPVAIPWYRSKILQGVVAGVVAQVFRVLESRFGVHILPGLDVEVVGWIMDVIAAGAVAYTARARLKQEAAPTVVLTKQKAESINATTQPPPGGTQ